MNSEEEFKYRFELVDNPTSTEHTETFTFGPKEVSGSDTWDGKFGINGRIQIKFTNIYGDGSKDNEIKAFVTTTNMSPGYSFGGLPDTRTGTTVVDVDEYTPLETPSTEPYIVNFVD